MNPTPGDYSIGSTLLPGTSKVIEEFGEALQVLGKFIGTGGDPEHWDGTDLNERIAIEFGDVLAAVAFWASHNMTPLQRLEIEDQAVRKMAQFEEWHRDQQG